MMQAVEYTPIARPREIHPPLPEAATRRSRNVCPLILQRTFLNGARSNGYDSPLIVSPAQETWKQ